MLRKYQTLFISSFLLVAWITALYFVLPVFAEEEEESDVAQVQCPEEITKVFNEQSTNFGKFIEATFLEKKANSELVGVAIDKYRKTRSFMNDYLENNFKPNPEYLDKMGIKPEASNMTMYLSINIYQECVRSLTKNYYSMLDTLLAQHIKVTASAKKTTQLVDKLTSINEKLRKTAFNVGLMQGYFETFNAKIPCTIKKCN